MQEIVEIKITDIKIGNRYRKEMGDLEGLAQSINGGQLLQPIGVTPDHELVFGLRRLLAFRDILKRATIPARIVDVTLLGQIDENVLRKDFTLTERIAIVDSLRTFSHGGDRCSAQARNFQIGSLTLAEACKRIGVSEDTYRGAKLVEEKGIPELVQAMDSGQLSIHAAETLAQGSTEEQQECLTKKIDTATAAKTALARIRSQKMASVVASVPLISAVALNTVVQGDCRHVIPNLDDNSIGLTICSPPYAEQRNGLYPGIPEEDYPAFTVEWMSKLWPKLNDVGSVLIVIDPHVKDGVLADYVLRTQLALREYGWKQHMPLMWFKEDRCPLGHTGWLRHEYEQVLWFSKTRKPFCDPKVGGEETDISAPRYKYSHCPDGGKSTIGIKRSSDVIEIPVSLTPRGVDHPAMFPIELAEQLIPVFCTPSCTVFDPFTGSGNSLLAAARLGHPFFGCDLVPEYVELARRRLAEEGARLIAG